MGTENAEGGEREGGDETKRGSCGNKETSIKSRAWQII